MFPDRSTYPLASNCFVFEENDSQTNLDVENQYPGLAIIPSLMGNKTVHVGTLLAELCSNILGEFSTVVCVLSRRDGIEDT